MTVLVRADADEQIGTGHVVRCAALVQRLPLGSEQVALVCRSITDGTRRELEQHGWTIRKIDPHAGEAADAEATLAAVSDLEPITLAVVDHYGLSADWEAIVAERGTRMVVIDDLADRPHVCDVLIDPTIGRTINDRVPWLVDAEAIQLLGPAYALLRREFDDLVPRPRDGRVEDLLVFLGGATSSDLLAPLVEALEAMGPECPQTTIVLGDAFVGGTAVHAAADTLQTVTILDRTTDMPGLMAAADLAIGATGGAQWERCAAGVPTLTVQTADNQEPDVAAFERLGATRHLGRLEEMTADTWLEALRWAMANSDAVAAMSAAAASLVAERSTAWAATRHLIVGATSLTPFRFEGDDR